MASEGREGTSTSPRGASTPLSLGTPERMPSKIHLSTTKAELPAAKP
jgi:hypothetical protein